MNILIFIFLLSTFFLDIIFTGIYASQYFYFLYLATAYYLSFYTPTIIPIISILLLNALQSFFITSIFGLWIIHLAPIIAASKISKKFLKNNYVLFGTTFLLCLLGNYALYAFYLHTTPSVSIFLQQITYNFLVLGCMSTIHYFRCDT